MTLMTVVVHFEIVQLDVRGVSTLSEIFLREFFLTVLPSGGDKPT